VFCVAEQHRYRSYQEVGYKATVPVFAVGAAGQEWQERRAIGRRVRAARTGDVREASPFMFTRCRQTSEQVEGEWVE